MRAVIALFLCVSSISWGISFGGEVPTGASAALAAGNAALERANSDPTENLTAALAFAKALPDYEAAGDQETCSEIRSVIFWCKKRMDVTALERFVAAKGDEGQALALALTTIEQPAPATDAGAYLGKAESYAQKHPSEHLKIAIRFFEVAHRFQGTPESLKAQRLSLDALQAVTGTAGRADEAVTSGIRSTPVAAKDLPEAAAKAVDASNKLVDAIALRASQEMNGDRKKAVEVILKEAEASQRKGELDQVMAHQKQAADLDTDVKGVSKGSGAAIETYRKARDKTITRAAAEVVAERRKLVQTLGKFQKDETKKGNTSEALAIKQTIDALTAQLEESSAASIAGVKASPVKPAEPHSSKDVILYPLPDFKGGPVIVRQFGNIINVSTLGFPSDGLRSIKVPLGVTVTVFEHEDGGGDSLELTYDLASLMGTKALKTTSLMITRNK